jgi:hypothetical protein
MVAPRVTALSDRCNHHVRIDVRRALGCLPPTTLSHPPSTVENVLLLQSVIVYNRYIYP